MKKSLIVLCVSLLMSTPSFAAMRLSGSSASSVQLLVYGDYYCPFTHRFIEYLPALIEEFEEDLSILYAHFPLRLREPAVEAAIVANCAHQQGLGLLFTMKMAQQRGVLQADDYVDLVTDLGLTNLETFLQCRDDRLTREGVVTEFQTGRAVGVSGTPNIFINGELIRGAFPLEEFQDKIRQALSE